MSKKIDERVVSMQFDNKNFEKNVSTTMSTLDKFKQKLNFKGATKGLEDVNAAAKKVDMNNLGKGVDAVQAKFSAMQVIGTTALVNITNSAVNAGKRIVSALTIDPVKTGFKEYETQINAVQTILANTESKGSTIDDVNKALEELNKYADMTIYNFTEMTRNIGTFTAAGVDLETSTNAIKGIANLAAVSGSTSQQASTAMYQLSQAMSSGVVKLMDWNSVVNAGMGGQVFQDALKETARVSGVAIDDIIASEGSFRESLSKGWLTTDILTDTLRKFTLTTEGLTEEQIESNREMLRAKGYTDEQIESIFKLGNTATNAATKVKTFTQMWDVLKEAAQSGWSQTWKIIIGDFEEAKALFTPVTDFLTGIINKMSDFRNRILEAVLGNPFADFLKKINDAGFGSIKKMIDGTNKLIGSLEYYQEVVNKVWRGDYNNRGDNPDRYDLLTSQGYNPRVVQELVNKGYKYKLTMEDVTAAQKKWGGETAVTAESIETTTIALEDLTDEQLRNAGFTESEIKIFRMLAKEAKKTGKSIQEYMNEMGSMDGRTRLIESFKNIGKGLANVFKTIGQAWSETFPFDETSLVFKLAMAIKSLYDWSVKFADGLKLVDDETGKASKKIDEIKRTFKGLFAALDIVLTIVGGPIKIVFKILAQLLGAFNIDVWWLTANIGDAIVAFRDWIDKVLDFTAVFEKIKPYVMGAVESIRAWFEATKPLEKVGGFFSSMFAGIKKWAQSSEALQKVGDFFKNAFSGIGTWFAGIKEAENIPKYIIQGLVKGLTTGIKTVFNAVIAIGKGIIDKVKEVLGIHSPSTEFIEIGKNIMAGLIVGIGSIKLLSIVTNVTNAIGALAAPLEGVGSVLMGTGKVLSKSAGGINKILKSTAKVVKSTTKVVKNFGKTIGSVGNLINAKALQTLAISIAILAGSIVVLSLLDPDKAWTAVKIVVSLAAVLAGLMIVVNKFGMAGPKGIKDAITGVKAFGQLATAFLAISASLLLLAVSLRIIGGMEWEELETAKEGLILLGLTLGALIISTKFAGASAGTINKTLTAIGGAMLILAVTLKILGGMEWEDLEIAKAGMILLGTALGALIISTKFAGASAGTINKTLTAIGGAMLILAVTLKILGGMEWEDLEIAKAGMILLGGVIVALIAATKLAGPNAASIGATLLAMTGAMFLLVLVAKMIIAIEWDDFGKAAVGLGGLAIVIRMMIKAVQLAKDPVKIAGTLLAMSLAVGILAGIAVLLSLVEIKALAKGIVAVGLLSAFMALMIVATRGASDCMKNLIVLAAAVAVMAGAVIALSFIDPGKLAGATIAMSIVMGMFAVMVSTAKTAKSSIGTLAIMTAAITSLGLILILLSQMPYEDTIGAAISLSTIMIALSASLFILSKIGTSAVSALAGIIALTAMAVPLLAFVGILALMQNIKVNTKAITALTLVVTAMTLLLIPLTLVGSFAVAALAGIIALTAMVVPMLTFIGAIALMNNVQNAQQNALILVTLMTTMTACLVSISLVAPLAVIAVAALNALVGVIVVFGVLATAIGALMTNIPMLEDFLDKGIAILEKIAYGLGSVLGNLVSGFAVSAMSGLPEMGLLLSRFMTNAMPFIMGARLIDKTAMDGVKSLAEVILILTAADLLEGLTSWLTGGGSSISDFGEEIAAFGPHLKKFADSVSGIDAEAVNAAANAAKGIAEMTKAIPNEGGVVGWFCGEQSITKYAGELPVLGTAIKKFSDSVDGINAENLSSAIDVAKGIVEMTNQIPKKDGVAQWFTGEQSISAYSDELSKLGTGIAAFATNVSGVTTSGISAAVDAAGAIVDISTNVPKSGGIASWFSGSTDLTEFGNQLGALGSAIATFASSVNDASDEGISKADTIMTNLSKFINNDMSNISYAMDQYGTQLKKLGDNIYSFIKKIGSAKMEDKAYYAVDILEDIIECSSTIHNSYVDNLGKFADSIEQLGETSIEKFIKGMKTAAATETALETMDSLAFSFAANIKSETSYEAFKSAGGYLVDGLAEGITDNKSAATKAAHNVANAVEKIFRSVWKINSPSKVFYGIALGIGEGIEYALSDSTSSVASSARDLADTTSRGFGNAISKINEMFDGTFDNQPTIRPVLDLSDVKAGANSIAGMFSGNRTLAISAPGIGAISASMASRQNGNNDLVSAINKLAKSKVKSGDTYQINGITYNEGSDVAEAIGTLVRAAKMEGRT